MKNQDKERLENLRSRGTLSRDEAEEYHQLRLSEDGYIITPPDVVRPTVEIGEAPVEEVVEAAPEPQAVEEVQEGGDLEKMVEELKKKA